MKRDTAVLKLRLHHFYMPILALSGMLFGYGLGKLWHLVTVSMLNLEGKQVIFGYHFHHTLLAFVPLFLLVFSYKKNWKKTSYLLIGLALGFVIEHRLTYGEFLLISRIPQN